MSPLFKTFKKIMAGVAIVSLFSQSALVFAPKTTYAQFSAGDISTGLSTGFAVAGVVGSVLSCVFPNGLNASVTGLAQSIFTSAETKAKRAKEEAARKAEEETLKTAQETAQKLIEAELKLTTVPVIDLGTINRTKAAQEILELKAEEQRREEEETKVKAQEEYKKTHCYDTIVHLITTMVIDRITLSTVDWINNGFKNSNGGNGPLWLEYPGDFFENMAKDETNKFTGWFACNINNIDCMENYPFGKLVMNSILINIQKHFAQNLQFSLNQVLAHGTYADFKVDFSVGGWAGYTAFLEPQNNPFGSYILANEELGRRISGTSINVAENFKLQLNQSGGFLNQRECALTATGNPNDQYIPGDHPLHLGEFYPVLAPGETLGDVSFASLPATVQDELDDFSNPVDQADAYNGLVLRSQCTKWKAVTPGSLIANQLTTNINLQNSKLVNADSLNEDLGLIFDALLNQLVEKGLSSLQGTDPSTNVALAQVNGLNPGSSGVTYPGQNPNQPSGTMPPVSEVVTGTGGVDLTLYQVQLDYIQAASIAVPILENQLIPKIYALDYCVPGPNPNWLSSAFTNLSEAVAAFPNPPVTNTPAQNQAYYSNEISVLTGATVNQSSNLESSFQFENFMNNVLERYAERMFDDYSLNEAPPTMRILLENLFTNLGIFQNDLAAINTYLDNIADVLPILSGVENALNQIATQNNGVLDENDPAVQAQLSVFESISDQLVTESQLTTLEGRIDIYNAQVGIMNSHLDDCLNETIFSVYPHPNRRVQYAFPYFNYPGLPTNPDSSFLPGINFGNGANDININFGGVNVTGTSNGLSTFETTIHSVY